MHIIKQATISAFLILCSQTIFAFDIGPKVSTLGVGIESTLYNFGPVKLRANASMLNYSKNLKSSSVDYDGKLKLRTIGIFADVHPFGNGLRLTGGLVHNKNRINVNARPSNNLNINGNNYNFNQIGTLDGSVKFKKFSPYLGTGYDMNKKAFTVSVELGVLFQGRPKVDIAATGLLGQNAQFLRDIREDAERKINKKLIRCYPVASLSIRF